jgi:hypothetical protein
VTRFPWLERIAVAVCGLALAVFLISLLSGYFTTRDQAAVSGTTDIGLKYVDQGNLRLAPGSLKPHYDSSPPTSGPHVPSPVTADGVRLSNDQILTALAAGDIVLLYGTPKPPAGLVKLATSFPFTPDLASSGDAVILAQRAGTRGVTALAWTRLLSVAGPSDPTLREFVNEFLGQGA